PDVGREVADLTDPRDLGDEVAVDEARPASLVVGDHEVTVVRGTALEGQLHVALVGGCRGCTRGRRARGRRARGRGAPSRRRAEARAAPALRRATRAERARLCGEAG